MKSVLGVCIMRIASRIWLVKKLEDVFDSPLKTDKSACLPSGSARLVGARWNSPGHAVVYMAESISLAVLENLVHMSREDFPTGYVVVGAIIPDTVEILSEEQLRISYSALPPQLLGDRWIESASSAVLRVPSAVVPNEFNYLLNPRHPAFSEIVTEIPAPYFFDRRLFSPKT